MDPKIRAAIAAIGEDAWTAITYPRAVWDEDQKRLISDAEVAEVPYTAFASKKGKAITARLIVRRVRDLNRKTAEGHDELIAVGRYHALFTDSPFETIQAETHHRDHATVGRALPPSAKTPPAPPPAWLAPPDPKPQARPATPPSPTPPPPSRAPAPAPKPRTG